MQMWRSTDRQVKSVQRNIFIHLYVKQIISQMCDFHTSNELDHVAFVLFRTSSSECFNDTHHIQFTTYISPLSCSPLSRTLNRGSFRYSFLCVCMCFVNCLQHRHTSEDKASQPVLTSPKVSASFSLWPKNTKNKPSGIWYTGSRYEGSLCVHMTSSQIQKTWSSAKLI